VEEEVLGKAYDGRLMRRLLTYVRPYKLPVFAALVLLLFNAALQVIGPLLTALAIDRYLAPSGESHSYHPRSVPGRQPLDRPRRRFRSCTCWS
jgi:ABC-type multidrug transport system fused ATPase/permease subunit